MTFQSIIVEVEEEVATLTLNRPEKLNALNPSLLQETAAVIREMNDDDKIKALIITGAGRGFCSGADLSEPVSAADVNQPGINRRERLSPFVRYGWMIRQIDEFTKPVIAAVNGIAAGGGLALALACDIRIASEDARFASIFVRRGLVADCGTTFYLPRLVGAAKALELMWTGDIIDAAEAARIGLVNRVVPTENLLKTTGEFALRLAQGPSVSIELHKRLTYEGLRADSVQTQMANEDYARYVCRQTDDVKEGRNSFLEKREPIFKGR
jgi:2-(1,2-epoxy-1,2-dihydrophenyl)acetyl-CoA isomerase